MHLPRLYSGLGFPRPSITAPAAFAGSCFSSISLQATILNKEEDLIRHHHSISALSVFNASISVANKVAPDTIPIKDCQHFLTTVQSKDIFETQIRVCDNPLVNAFMKCQAVACTVPGANGFIHVPPIHNDVVDYRLSNDIFYLSLRLALGLPVFTTPTACPFCKNGINDVHGIHAVACNGKGSSTNRHDCVRNLIHSYCNQGRLVAEMEVSNILEPVNPLDPLKAKRVDNLIHHVSTFGGSSVAVDVTIAASTHGHSNNVPDFKPEDIFNVKSNLKNDKYKAICEQENYKFIPFVCLSLGGLCPNATALIKYIATAVAEVQGVDHSAAVQNMRNSIAIALAKSQAYAILSRGLQTESLFSSPSPLDSELHVNNL